MSCLISRRLNAKTMTYQEFNHIYYKFTKSPQGIKPMDKVTTNGFELKQFVEFALENLSQDRNQQMTFNGFDF